MYIYPISLYHNIRYKTYIIIVMLIMKEEKLKIRDYIRSVRYEYLQVKNM